MGMLKWERFVAIHIDSITGHIGSVIVWTSNFSYILFLFFFFTLKLNEQICFKIKAQNLIRFSLICL